ncbi:hypothetical protein E3P89_03779 [Wallemia ichthyophaga]|uniref:NAA35-like TPR repeats domain-containing protein n=1 Tax=Wallemia ichthyophaga TaxID=245174 RepID=A0A4T0J058_WALIC|nr:hypothetical protein E3P98_03823 [Wallemia ichthyophaga]TIA88394.1 hypothetical protein E3P97_03522 [Wallemia ichthyophaga]TIB16678.1 hypothetical protein E3P90_00317 [Wallemia ichthyophaga]TIB18341.1 hypothetical protein E3P93_00174 [Wallemia ichthyophaga]TIB19650.1 hypothetical protein E3P89_03779 [Wallemia ichthyophaga]
MYDIEDFNSDKAGLSLGEMYNDQDVEILLIESLNWINHKLESDSNNDIIIGLRDRIQLRLNLFSIYNPYLTNCPSDNPRQLDESLSLINHAIEIIKIISPSPSPSTKVSNSFYSGISKYLPNMAPLPPLDDALLDIQGKNVWEGFKPSLECFRDINKAIRVQDPLEWINWLSSRSISKPSERALPSYLRNLTLSRFISDDNLIFNQHSIEWITDSLLQGMIGLPHGVLDLVIRLKQAEMTVVGRNPMSIGQALSVWSQRVAGFYVNLVSTYCHNRPRQKRNLPKSIKQFEELDNEIETVHQPSTKSLQPLSPTLATLFALIPFAMRSFILSLNIESLLVTTELDLLDKEHDWFIIYWQLSRVARSWQYELNQASSSLSSLPVDNRVGFTEAVKHNALEWMKERTLFASIMDHLSQATLNASALHIIKLNTPSLSTGERQARFQRRLKWTMRGNIPRDTHSVRDIETDPSFELYDKDLFVLNGNATTEAATRYYESALEKINLSLSINTSQAHLKLSEEKRDSTLQALKLICETNIDKVKNTSSTQQHTLQWSNALQPWFPNLASSIN